MQKPLFMLLLLSLPLIFIKKGNREFPNYIIDNNETSMRARKKKKEVKISSLKQEKKLFS